MLIDRVPGGGPMRALVANTSEDLRRLVRTAR
jgi:hypothetical protein